MGIENSILNPQRVADCLGSRAERMTDLLRDKSNGEIVKGFEGWQIFLSSQHNFRQTTICIAPEAHVVRAWVELSSDAPILDPSLLFYDDSELDLSYHAIFRIDKISDVIYQSGEYVKFIRKLFGESYELTVDISGMVMGDFVPD